MDRKPVPVRERPVKYYNQAKNTKYRYNWWATGKDGIADEDRYEHLWQVVRGIVEKQQWRSYNNLRFARLYHNMELIGLDPGMYARTALRDNYLTNRVTLNVIKSCIDTASSKIAKSKPRPFFLTDNGDWSQQMRAKKATYFMDGWFNQTKTYAKGRMAFQDSGVFGTGALHFFKENKGVQSERVIIEEIIVDEAEGMYGCPQNMYRKKTMHRDVAASLWPQHANKIFAANSAIKEDYRADYYADMVTVVEGWHLPSGYDSDRKPLKDGRHTLAIDNCTLTDEVYEKMYFPFAFQRWTKSVLGFYGIGLAEELVGIQLEINKILRNIQLAQHLMAVPQVWLEASNAATPNAKINNAIGGIHYYTGQPPQFLIPNAMNQEIYAYLESLYRKAYEITGVSSMSAQSKKPAGVTAAVALETLSDLETERFMITAQEYEEFYLQGTDIVTDMMDDLQEEYGDVEINAPYNDYMRRLSWKEVRLDKESYITKVYPTNLLPTQPAGKLQRVQEMMQAGFFDREDAISLLDYPDLKAVSGRITAPRDDVLKIIAMMLEDGKYVSPEPFMNLALARKITQSEYNKAKLQDAPDERLDLLRRFMDDCDTMIAIVEQQKQQNMMEAQAAMAAQGAPAEGMAPTAQPAALPVNELMQMGGAQ